jgi:hypothetical protein
MKTPIKKLCPVCGEKAVKTGKTTDGRIILSCGDACYARMDSKGREYWMLRPAGKPKPQRSFGQCQCPECRSKRG